MTTAPSTTDATATVGLQCIDEMTMPPVVGQRYIVPTVVYPWHLRKQAWPVMGPKHTDADHLKFPHEHYHVDVRFLSPGEYRFAAERYFHNSAEHTVAAAPLQSHGEKQHPDPVYQMRWCYRAEHGYPLGTAQKSQHFVAMFSAYAGRHCARNAAGLLICPHKGFALDTLVPDAEGRVVCPLHGLIIDKAEGVVIENAAALSRVATR